VTLDELNSLSDPGAAEALTACCGAHRWVSAMIARRPFASVEAVVAAANDVWRETSERDWREAFDHHPRIGERQSASEQNRRASSWSAGEQSRAASANADVQRQLVETNAEYEARFGHIYIVCAAGRSAGELLDIARSRLHNDPATELRIAAEEQRKITELRLRKLFSEAT
jgi:OHCU decarboxylase